MNDAQLKDLVLRTLGDVAPDAELAGLDPAIDLRQALDIDSMDFLNFVIALHEATGVDIPEIDYPKLASVEAAVAYLRSHRTGGG